MKKGRLILPLVIFILLLNLVFAIEDFEINAPNKVNLCPCSGQSYNIEIINTGTETSTYNIIPSTNNKYDWANPYASEFTLQPNQKTKLPITVDSVCNIYGKAAFDFVVNTNKGLSKDVSQSYRFDNCYNYTISKASQISSIEDLPDDFSPHEGDYSLCSEESRMIPILFKNRDEVFKNSYDVNVLGESWATSSLNQFPLEAKKSGVFFINLNPPADSEGIYDFTLESKTEKGETKRDLNFTVEVLKCHVMGLDIVDEEDTLCSGDSKDYILNLDNQGATEEVLQLEINGPTWVTLTDNVATIASNSQEDITLTAKPDSNSSGLNNIEVKASSDFIELSDSFTINVDSLDTCYAPDIFSSSSYTNRYHKEFYPIRIRNSGLKDTTYDVSIVNGPDWISVDPKILNLDSGEQWNINIKAEPSQEISSGPYPFQLMLKNSNSEYTRDLTLELKNESFSSIISGFIIYFRYYFYLVAVLIIITFINLSIFRWKFIHKFKENKRQKQIRKKRLDALKKAHEARRLKKSEDKIILSKKK